MFQTGHELRPALQPVFALLVQGRTEKEIASEIHKSVHSVHSYVKRIYRAFGVESRGQLLAVVLAQAIADRERVWRDGGPDPTIANVDRHGMLRQEIDQLQAHATTLMAATTAVTSQLEIVIAKVTHAADLLRSDHLKGGDDVPYRNAS